MSTVKVIDYLPEPHNFHICQFEDGHTEYIDLLTDGLDGVTDEELVGKTVTFDYTHPYLTIAHNVVLKESSLEKQE